MGTPHRTFPSLLIPGGVRHHLRPHSPAGQQPQGKARLRPFGTPLMEQHGLGCSPQRGPCQPAPCGGPGWQADVTGTRRIFPYVTTEV